MDEAGPSQLRTPIRTAAEQQAESFLSTLIAEDGKELVIELRKEDGYVNATKLGQGFTMAKHFSVYKNLKRTGELLKELSTSSRWLEWLGWLRYEIIFILSTYFVPH